MQEQAMEHGGRRWLRVGEVRFSAVIPIAIGLVVVLVALALRWELRHFLTNDMRNFLVPWYRHLETNGAAGFGVEFANYNFPYLFLIYLVTKLPVSAITGIKFISVVFDLLMAVFVGLIVGNISGSTIRGGVAALVALLLPTVVLNSAMWGQSDVVYTVVGLAAVHAALKDRSVVAWILMGAALAVKLQAIFFLPVLALLWLRGRSRWWAPVLAIPTWLVLTLPPVLFGRPVGDVLGIYIEQSDTYHQLTMGLPNAYAWIPGAQFETFVGPGKLVAVAALGLMFLVAYTSGRTDPIALLTFAAATAAVAPFLLPQMHERYNYPFEVLALILAAVLPRLAWLMVGSQVAAMWGYSQYLFQETLMPEWSAALTMLAVVVGIVSVWVLRSTTDERSGHEGKGPADPVPRNAVATAEGTTGDANK